MFSFLTGLTYPESFLADQNDLFPVFTTQFDKQEICKNFPQIHIMSHLGGSS